MSICPIPVWQCAVKLYKNAGIRYLYFLMVVKSRTTQVKESKAIAMEGDTPPPLHYLVVYTIILARVTLYLTDQNTLGG